MVPGLQRQLRGGDIVGAAAIEFAFILPILTALVVVGLDGWLRINQVSQMRSAIQSGSRYYQSGGADDTAASTLGLAAWAHRPGDATLAGVRVCKCGTTVVDCTTQCPGSTLPMVFVTLTATGTFSGLWASQSLTETGGVRLR